MGLWTGIGQHTEEQGLCHCFCLCAPIRQRICFRLGKAIARRAARWKQAQRERGRNAVSDLRGFKGSAVPPLAGAWYAMERVPTIIAREINGAFKYRVYNATVRVPLRSTNPATSWIGPMNVLPFDQQVTVISALTEGCSIRAVERLTGVHRDTILRLAARVGFGAIKSRISPDRSSDRQCRRRRYLICVCSFALFP
jgi:hypothetical protein